MSTEPLLITAQGLTRRFGKTTAVDGLDLAIPAGELFGLVGPDGAGKTTTLRLLAGLLTISAGEAQIAGYDLARQPEAIKPRLGYMAQRFSLYAELTVTENLNFFAELFGLSQAQRRERTPRLLEFAGLSEFRNRRAAHLSGGMQKKLALACTLIHQPEILLLDEPTTGVDPISRREFWEILTELHLTGTTILVSTPYMDEADRCSTVGLLYAGQMVRCAAPQEIRRQVRGEIVALSAADWEAAHQVLESLPGVLEVQTYGDRLHALVDSSRKRLPQIKRAMRQAGVEALNLQSAPLRMEEAFISIVRQMEIAGPGEER